MMLFTLLFVSVNIFDVNGLTCLTCQGIIQPRHCRLVQECAATETHCITEEVLDDLGHHVYNLGCASGHVCGQRPDEQCQDCCESDLCNAEGCGQPGYPAQRGPICYDCPMTIQGTPCQTITYCQMEEECNIRGRYEFGDELFVRGCANQHACRSNNSQVIVGKRSGDDRGVQFHCNVCCSSDFCNEVCNTQAQVATDCYDLLHNFGHTTSGIYSITLPHSRRVIQVFCDMDTNGGGWTVFQRRTSADVDFYRTMSEYVHGFGSLSGNFWLGLESVHEMTSAHFSKLYIIVEAADGNWSYTQYNNFSLSSGPEYTLHITPRPGVRNDTDMEYNNGCRFSTYDSNTVHHLCASYYHGAWWYNNCFRLNLNGDYATPGTISSYGDGRGGMVDIDFRAFESLKRSYMMFRRN